MAGFHKIRENHKVTDNPKVRDNHYYLKNKQKMGGDSSTSWSLLRVDIIEIHISQGLLESVKL